jgi:hypothetical protein
MESYDQKAEDFSSELQRFLHDRSYRKMLVGVGNVFHTFLQEGIDGYDWKKAIQQVFEENSTAFRQFIEDAEDAPDAVMVDDNLVDNVLGEVVGFFLTSHEETKASEESGIASVAHSPMVSAFRNVLYDVIDRIGVDRMFPDVHQHLTRAKLD